MSIRGFISRFSRLELLTRRSLLLVVMIVFTLKGNAQVFKFSGNKKKQEIQFQLIKNLIVIPIYINGVGPYNFLLDTGVAQTIITDTTFLANLNLKKYNQVKIQGYGFGEEIDAIFTRDITATIGKATILNVPTAIFKRDVFDLSSYLGIRVYGIIGFYLFNSFVVKINYSSNQITLYDPSTTIRRKGIKIPMQILSGKPYIKAEITTDSLPKTEVDLLVDNGSSHPMLLESYLQKPFPLPKTTIPANLGVGINGIVNGSLGRINKLKIADFSFDEVLAGFPEFNNKRIPLEGQSRNGSLGADVLRHFVVTFDYPHEAMYLKKSNSFKNKFEHDMSGLEIYMIHERGNHFFIGRIEEGSPAEEIGLQMNDEIISIDLQAITSLSLSDLNELMKDRDGKKMILEVVRKKIRLFVMLKLKRRI